MRNYEFGLRGHDIADNFESMCHIAKQEGIKKLQFAPAKTMQNINFDELGYSRELSEKMKQNLEKYDLTISVLGCYINPIHPDKNVCKMQLNRFKDFIYYAKDLQAKAIGTETGFTDDIGFTHSKENYQTFLKNMCPLIDIAEQTGVTVGIEPVWGNTIHTVEVMKRLIDDVQSENLAVILDVSNIMHTENLREQKQIITKAFDLFGEKICAVHVKDFQFVNGKKIFAIAGTGQLEIQYLFQHINALSVQPELILDTLPLEYYHETNVRLNSLLQNL